MSAEFILVVLGFIASVSSFAKKDRLRTKLFKGILFALICYCGILVAFKDQEDYSYLKHSSDEIVSKSSHIIESVEYQLLSIDSVLESFDLLTDQYHNVEQEMRLSLDERKKTLEAFNKLNKLYSEEAALEKKILETGAPKISIYSGDCEIIPHDSMRSKITMILRNNGNRIAHNVERTGYCVVYDSLNYSINHYDISMAPLLERHLVPYGRTGIGTKVFTTAIPNEVLENSTIGLLAVSYSYMDPLNDTKIMDKVLIAWIQGHFGADSGNTRAIFEPYIIRNNLTNLYPRI